MLNTDRSLVFFDDHQNAYRRLRQCKWFGFKDAVFEDNYPGTRGDCYSLKKAFANAGFEPADSRPKRTVDGMVLEILRRFSRILGFKRASFMEQYGATTILPNDVDSRILKKNLDIYYEFPPVFKTEKTRWHDAWDSGIYPTPEPLLEASEYNKSKFNVFWVEATFYTWLCYVRLK